MLTTKAPSSTAPLRSAPLQKQVTTPLPPVRMSMSRKNLYPYIQKLYQRNTDENPTKKQINIGSRPTCYLGNREIPMSLLKICALQIRKTQICSSEYCTFCKCSKKRHTSVGSANKPIIHNACVREPLAIPISTECSLKNCEHLHKGMMDLDGLRDVGIQQHL